MVSEIVVVTGQYFQGVQLIKTMFIRLGRLGRVAQIRDILFRSVECRADVTI